MTSSKVAATSPSTWELVMAFSSASEMLSIGNLPNPGMTTGGT